MKKWTILIFLAADNNLNSFAERNLHQMEHIGSTNDVDIVVQIDRYGTGTRGTALRGRVTWDPDWKKFAMGYKSTLTDIGETNTGDPAVLQEFIEWGAVQFPAEQYALILWNHGSGWKPDFIYKIAENVADARFVDAMRAVGFAEQYGDRLARVLFKPTAVRMIGDFIQNSVMPLAAKEFHASISPRLVANNCPEVLTARNENVLNEIDFRDLITRAIGLDESSAGDALDCIELKTALTVAAFNITQATGKPFKFNIIGFDACLMAGIEVAFQLRELCDFSIASEEIEPGVGWHYDLIVEFLSRQAGVVDGRELARQIVSAYTVGLVDYRIRLVTLSALDSAKVGSLVTALNAVGTKIDSMLGTEYGLVARSEKTATRFFDTDYLDIGDFLHLLNVASPAPELTTANNVRSQAVVAAEFLFASAVQRPSGLSVYFPTKPQFDAKYAALDISAAMRPFVSAIKKYHFID